MPFFIEILSLQVTEKVIILFILLFSVDVWAS